MTPEENKAYMHDYYLKNKAKNAEKNKAYREAHKEEKRAYDAIYHAKNKEKRSIQAREYYKAHREEAIARTKAWKLSRILAKGFKVEDIEGYDGFKEKTIIHHRLEDLGFSSVELASQGFYTNCQPCDLVFMTMDEHNKHHSHKGQHWRNDGRRVWLRVKVA